MTPQAVSEAALIGFLPEQRWYGAKSREIAHVGVIERVPLPLTSPLPDCAVALVEVRSEHGASEYYQLLLAERPSGERWRRSTIETSAGRTRYEGLADPLVARALVELIMAGAQLEGQSGTLELRPTEGAELPAGPLEHARVLGSEQSNSSLVFDERLILKLYRRLEAGLNPELELLRFLTLNAFPNIAPLRGSYQYAGAPIEATLGIVQDFVPSSIDGWSFALESLGGDPDEFVSRARQLGEVTGALHSVLASDAANPAFAPEEPSVESLGLLIASIEDEVMHLFHDLPDKLEILAPIRGRGEELREYIRGLSHTGSLGKLIRQHGDYHLGQVLWTGEDWVLLDFEGEPARSFAERRQKRSPLRDVAGMLRSFAYAAAAGPLLHQLEPPPDFELRLRASFIAGYLGRIDVGLMPSSDHAFERLLALFELEKAVYELRYELDNRPEWLAIPVAGIERLLGDPVA